MQCRTLQLIKKTMALRAAHMWLDSLSKQLSTQVYTCLVYTKSFFDLKLNKKKKTTLGTYLLVTCLSVICAESKGRVSETFHSVVVCPSLPSGLKIELVSRFETTPLVRRWPPSPDVSSSAYSGTHQSVWYSIYGILFMVFCLCFMASHSTIKTMPHQHIILHRHNKDYVTPAYHISH